MRIVCTGYGVIAPGAKNTEQYLHNLQNGICSLDVIDTDLKGGTTIVGLVKEGLEAYELNKKLKRIPRVTKLGIAATEEAIQSAGIEVEGLRVGVFFGTSLGASGEQFYQDAVGHALNGNYRSIPVSFSHYANYHSITAAIAHYVGVKGVVKTIVASCTSGLEAIEDAMLYLKSKKIDVAIVGGTDSPITQSILYAFSKIRLLPLGQSLNEGAVPFEKNSKGFAMAEAAGALVLEREDDATHRDADVKGEIMDVVSNNDGVNLFSLEETGEQLMNALSEVTSGRNPDYINSQALGVSINDQIEHRTSEILFNHKIPYTSIKGMYGHPFGAVGILQVIASFLSVNHNFIPPTIKTSKNGYENMNIVTETKYQEVKEVAITNHGHGGNNACAYIKKY